MSDWLLIIGSLLAGMALGTIFFAGLWLTVRIGLSARYPALWFSISIIVRLAIVAAGFYFFSGHRWQQMLPLLVGFFAARTVITRLLIKTKPTQDSHSGGEPHES